MEQERVNTWRVKREFLGRYILTVAELRGASEPCGVSRDRSLLQLISHCSSKILDQIMISSTYALAQSPSSSLSWALTKACPPGCANLGPKVSTLYQKMPCRILKAVMCLERKGRGRKRTRECMVRQKRVHWLWLALVVPANLVVNRVASVTIATPR